MEEVIMNKKMLLILALLTSGCMCSQLPETNELSSFEAAGSKDDNSSCKGHKEDVAGEEKVDFSQLGERCAGALIFQSIMILNQVQQFSMQNEKTQEIQQTLLVAKEAFEKLAADFDCMNEPEKDSIILCKNQFDKLVGQIEENQLNNPDVETSPEFLNVINNGAKELSFLVQELIDSYSTDKDKETAISFLVSYLMTNLLIDRIEKVFAAAQN